MDFPWVLRKVIGWLEARQADVAVIGGVALAAYGHSRMTLDVDLVVDAEVQDALMAFMEAQGYRTLHRSAGYSNHVAADPKLGRVDFVYVKEETRERIFAECRRLPGPGGMEISVVQPAHLIAMKIQAIANDRSRLFQDLADIRYLLENAEVDLEEVRDRFARAGLGEYFEELVRGL